MLLIYYPFVLFKLILPLCIRITPLLEHIFKPEYHELVLNNTDYNRQYTGYRVKINERDIVDRTVKVVAL